MAKGRSKSIGFKIEDAGDGFKKLILTGEDLKNF